MSNKLKIIETINKIAENLINFENEEIRNNEFDKLCDLCKNLIEFTCIKNIKKLLTTLDDIKMEQIHKIKMLDKIKESLYFKIINNVKSKIKETDIDIIQKYVIEWIDYLKSYTPMLSKYSDITDSTQTFISDDNYIHHVRKEILNRLTLLVKFFGYKFLRKCNVTLYTIVDINYFTFNKLILYYEIVIQNIKTFLKQLNNNCNTYININYLIADNMNPNDDIINDVIDMSDIFDNKFDPR